MENADVRESCGGASHGGTESGGTRTAGKKRANSGGQSTSTHKKQKVLVKENLLMKLSPELRNKIYEVALSDQPTVGASTAEVLIGKHRRHRLWLVGAKDERSVFGELYPLKGTSLPPWREPGLLQVSKQIREEAKSIYYNDNSLLLVVRPEELEEAVDWLESIASARGDKLLQGLRLVVPSMRWRDLPTLFALAKFIMDSKIKAQDVLEEATSWKGCFDFKAYRTTPTMKSVKLAFEELIMMAVKAKWRKTSMEVFLEDFKDWADARLERNYRSHEEDWKEVLME